MEQQKRGRTKIPKFEIDPYEPVFSATVVSRLLDIPIWTLKQLEAEGIVGPQRRMESEARLYSHFDVDLIHYCWEYMKSKGVKVKGLKIILQLEGILEGDEEKQ